jgi:hypothetical protein
MQSRQNANLALYFSANWQNAWLNQPNHADVLPSELPAVVFSNSDHSRIAADLATQ